jgi:hypothetical protein
MKRRKFFGASGATVLMFGTGLGLVVPYRAYASGGGGGGGGEPIEIDYAVTFTTGKSGLDVPANMSNLGLLSAGQTQPEAATDSARRVNWLTHPVFEINSPTLQNGRLIFKPHTKYKIRIGSPAP